MYSILLASQAKKDKKIIEKSVHKSKYHQLLDIIKHNPYQNPPPYEKLDGNKEILYSRRINIQHRLVYQIYETEKLIKIISSWSHYENL
ncbi:addiction module protein [Clostridia bacterium]|nr:addiction module protein [Clostridia bacterium]